MNQAPQFCTKPAELIAKPWSSVYFIRNLFRFCTKLKKVPQRRFFRCIQVKNHFRFRRTFLLRFPTLQLIWKLFDIYRTFLRGLGKNLFFLECTFYIYYLDLFLFLYFSFLRLPPTLDDIYITLLFLFLSCHFN